MARARNIKPGFFKNEDLAECSPWARLCFAGLWTLADREGRLEDRPKRIKGELFAFDSVEVEPLLVELQRFGFIERYQVNGLDLIQVIEFLKHQNPHHREPDSGLPPPKSLGLKEVATPEEPKASPPLKEHEAPGRPQASPGHTPPRSDLARGSSRADSGTRIPDSGGEKEKGPSKASVTPPKPDDVTEQTWGDWLTLRRSKKAPVTVTVLREAKSEARKAKLPLEDFLRVWCARGSQGLQADWLKPHEREGPQRQTATDRRIATIEGLTGRSIRHDRPADTADIVDIAARLVP